MIIHKGTKSVETRSGKPNENFGNYENVFVVDEGNELGKKILDNTPYFDFVLDDNGGLINIIPTERPPEPTPEPTELELLKEKYDTLQGAVDFIIMNP